MHIEEGTDAVPGTMLVLQAHAPEWSACQYVELLPGCAGGENSIRQLNVTLPQTATPTRWRLNARSTV